MRDDCWYQSQKLRAGAYFNPRPSHEGRHGGLSRVPDTGKNFNPRPSHEGRPIYSGRHWAKRRISIHVPRMRDDHRRQPCSVSPVISIHVPRMRDDAAQVCLFGNVAISIHVPRMRDDFFKKRVFPDCVISIHVPRMRDDHD